MLTYRYIVFISYVNCVATLSQRLHLLTWIKYNQLPPTYSEATNLKKNWMSPVYPNIITTVIKHHNLVIVF